MRVTIQAEIERTSMAETMWHKAPNVFVAENVSHASKESTSHDMTVRDNDSE